MQEQEAGSREGTKRLHQGEQLIGQRVRKLRIVDVRVKLPNADVRLEVFSQCGEQCGIRRGIMKRLAVAVDHAHAT